MLEHPSTRSTRGSVWRAVLAGAALAAHIGCPATNTPLTPANPATGGATGVIGGPPAHVVAGYSTAVPDAAPVPDQEHLFMPRDVFELEWASDPRVSPDGRRVVYVRNFMDIMQDQRRSALWSVDVDGGDGNDRTHRPLSVQTNNHNVSSPRFSPDGTRVAYVTGADGKAQLFIHWFDTGQTAKITNLVESPANLTWSPDGRMLAFNMLVRESKPPMAKMPSAPEGAEWAAPPQVIDKFIYREDGAGYLPDGYMQLFVVPADGGTPRRLTDGPYHHAGELSWAPDSRSIVLSSNRDPDWEYQPRESEVYDVSLVTGAVQPLTRRKGPDAQPQISPDGKRLLYVGFDDAMQGYQITRLYVADRDGNNPRDLLPALDRDVENPVWAHDGRGIYFQYDDKGDTKIAYVSLVGKLDVLADGVGGESIGRPYAGGSFTVSKSGTIAFVSTSAAHPADVAVRLRSGGMRRLTWLNRDLLGHKKLAELEEIWFESSFDQRKVQGWLLKPPGFDSKNRYPLMLEIHGGPFANYGSRFSAELQLYASAGYVVLYLNPRGSTSYGQEFGNLIHHNYPGQDYDDLMSGVDAVIGRGYIDEDRLFVTGGSGGGVLSSWIVGKTQRFRAAVVAKPVINWYSFALSTDSYNYYWQYWFPGYPWEYPEHYHKRSPLSLVGNVSTPTMLLTGEADHRTPISESEQFYQALKLRKIDTALVRVPGASHGMTRRPSQLIAKVVYILAWFEKHDTKARDTTAASAQAPSKPPL